MTLEAMYQELERRNAFRPKWIMHHFWCTRYKANKVIKMFRDKGLVRYEIDVDKWCEWECINEWNPHCECWPPNPPMWIRVKIKVLPTT